MRFNIYAGMYGPINGADYICTEEWNNIVDAYDSARREGYLIYSELCEDNGYPSFETVKESYCVRYGKSTDTLSTHDLEEIQEEYDDIVENAINYFAILESADMYYPNGTQMKLENF